MSSLIQPPFNSPQRRVLNDYLRRLSQLPTPPHTPIFLPGEAVLLFHKRMMVAPHPFNSTFVECYYCTLTTRTVGRTWILEAAAQQIPCAVFLAGSPPNGDAVAPLLVRNIILEKRDDRAGPDPGWGDLRRVILRETEGWESAYFVDGRTGAVEGLDA